MQSFSGGLVGLISCGIRQRHILLGGRCFCTAVATSSAATGYNRNPRALTAQIQASTLNQGRRSRSSSKMVPWLMIPSISSSSEISCHLYDITNSDAAAGGIPLESSSSYIKEVRLPFLGSTIIGSSEGFLIFLDRKTNQIQAVNPLTGDYLPNIPSIVDLPWKVHPLDRPIPHGGGTEFDASYFPILFKDCKAVLSPSLDTIVLVSSSGASFARLGSSRHWSLLPNPLGCLCDCVFHDNRLYCLDYDGSLVIYSLDRPMAIPLVAPPGPSEYHRDTDYKRFLVQSPDGNDLFYIYRRSRKQRDEDDDPEKCPRHFRVFKLNKIDDDGDNSYKWNQVTSIGDIAMFVGTSYSVSLPSCDLLNLMKPDCIYFTHTPFITIPVNTKEAAGVYDLENNSTQFYKICDSVNTLNTQPVWYMPSLPQTS